jgi:acyl-CoA thioesterase II
VTENLTLPQLMTVSAGETKDVFVGQAESYGRLGIYGGHFLGQALAAGFETVDGSKLAQSFHAYFIKAGNPVAPIHYHVTRIREGRKSELRNIEAKQEGEAVFTMHASFKVPEVGESHQPKAPVVDSPESVIQAREDRGESLFPFPITQHGRVQMEFITESFREFTPDRDPFLRLWMRVPGCESIDEHLKQCVLAYLSDGTLMFNSVIPYGTPFQSHRLTSLDQSVWFHRPIDPGQWMLYDQRSTAVADGRGLNRGEIFDNDGQLIASTVQESMLRKIPDQ